MAENDTAFKIISRKEAKALGLVRYFTGCACKFGHLCERYVVASKCIECGKNNSRRCIAANPERRLEYSRRWDRNNKWHRRQYYAKNRDAIIARAKRWWKSHQELDKKRAAAWRLSHPDKAAAAIRKWRLSNLDKAAAKERNRNARKRGNGGTHTAADIHNIFKMQHGKCACCRIYLRAKYHVDHIKPVSKGGSNDRRNLQVLCVPCNLRKHDLDPIEFMQAQGALI